MSNIQFVLSLVKVSYEQELERLKRINQKADNLTRYISIYLVMLNLVIPFLNNVNIKLPATPWKYYLISVIPAVISLVIAVVAQAIDKLTLFPLGYDLEKDIVDHPEEYDSEIKRESKEIALYDAAIEAISENNDWKIRFIIIGHIFYAVSVVDLAIMVFQVLSRVD